MRPLDRVCLFDSESPGNVEIPGDALPEVSLRKSQTRAQSALEAVTSVAIGYVVALAAQAIILPMWGIHVDASTHMGIAACFTGLSVVRTYFVRRLFERDGREAPK